MSDYRESARAAAKETRWTFFKFLPIFVAIVLILSGVGFGLNSLGLFGRTVVERKVFEQSFQRSEALNSAMATFSAQLSEIDLQLMNPSLDEDARFNLRAQKSAINVRISALKEKMQ